MAVSHKRTDEVLAAARKDLKDQLEIVREEMARLGGEERALTEALSSLNGASARSAATAPAGRSGDASTAGDGSSRKSSARKTGAGRRRGPRAASKSTADRVKELQGVLANGPKSRNDLAAALKVSPARVQQLLAELGSSVSSQPDPGQRQGKLWTLKGAGNGASPAKPTAKPTTANAKTPAARKPAGKAAAAK